MPKTGAKNPVRVSTILVSQPPPENEKNPYFDIAKKFKVKIDFRPFITIESIPARDFRKARINPYNYNSIILTSRNATDHFFRICEEMRIHMPQATRFFCTSEAIALYLQKYMQYRKRKVFHADGTIGDLCDLLKRQSEGARFLLPCSDVHIEAIPEFMEKNNYDFDKAIIYRTVPSDLSDLEDLTYDMIIFFSPSGIKSLFHNFPKFKQRNTQIAAFGPTTAQAVEDAGLKLTLRAPQPEAKSMTASLAAYLADFNS